MNCNDTSSNQPPLPGQTQSSQNGTSSSDVTKVIKSPSICKDYTWGKCNKNKQCKFRHELIFEEMKEILKFCHDYQNPKGCIRENCTYLHTTKEEEDLFLTQRKIPRVLEERYRAMQMSTSMPETIPQIALFIKESLVGPPPPPPPLPMPVENPNQFVRMTPMVKYTNLPPPPPPPPPPPTQPSTSVQPPLTPTYTAPPPHTMATYIGPNHPPASAVKFDASVPPPPLPNHVQIKHDTFKRLSPCNYAGASKKRRTEDNIVADTLCEQCSQRSHRVEEFKEETYKLSAEDECDMLQQKKISEAYTRNKEFLRSIVSPEIYQLVEESLEGVPPQLDVLAQLRPRSFQTGMSMVPKHFLLQLMDYYFSNNTRTVKSTPSPALRLGELLQSMRRSGTSNTPDRHLLLDLLTSFGSSPESLDLESNKNLPSGNNELHRVSGQMLDITPPNAAYTVMAPYSVTLPAATQSAMLPTVKPAVPPLTTAQPTYPTVPPLTTAQPTYPTVPPLTTAQPTYPTVPPITTAQPTYPTYEPTMPPPNKQYTPYSTASTSSQNMSYCQVRMDQAPHLLKSTPIPTPEAASTKINCHSYGMGRYPGPYHYYQQYQ